jgi:signal transduction histidine kinase
MSEASTSSTVVLCVKEYLAWGATAEVAQLHWAYPARRPPADATAGGGTDQSGDLTYHRAAVTAGTVDLLGILSASQALSSETSIGRLHARVVEVLSAMTGATGVRLLLWDADRHRWLLPAPDADGGTVPVSGTGQEAAVPMSALRYVQRTGEPLVVADAARDDRFSRDPYFAGADCCSLLAVPIFSRRALRAVLLLENRLLGGAFTGGRLDAVQLIAGQLAVSLDNAQLYAESRQIAGEQAALRRVATLVARAAAPREVFAAVAGEVGRLLAADLAVLDRFDPEGTLEVVGSWTRTGAPAPVPVGGRLRISGRNVTTLVYQTGRPARIDGYADGSSGAVGPVVRVAGFRSVVGAPVFVEGRLWGMVAASSRREQPLPSNTEARLASFTELVATAVANAEGRAELMASRARIVAAADETRRRIERDLHDGAQQRLVSLALKLRTAQTAVPPGLGGPLDEAVAEANGALAELTEIARGIHPAVLTERGLGAALRTLARRSPIPVDLQVRAGQRLPEPVEVSAYYIAAEALTNAAKHSGASAVAVEVEVAGDVLRVVVRDDGAGGADLARGTGLAGLKDRVQALGGRIFLHSPPDAGTSLQAEFPLTATNDGATSR